MQDDIEPRIEMSAEELREFVRTSSWTFAKTMPQQPHEYTLRARAPDENLFERVALDIRQVGYEANYGSATYTYLDIDGWKYWTMGAPLGPTGEYDPTIHTILINRANLKSDTPKLSQGKQEFFTIISLQGLGHDLARTPYPPVPETGEFYRITFAIENGIQDLQAADTRDFTENMVKLQVHFAKSLLHMHDVFGCHLHQALPVPPK